MLLLIPKGMEFDQIKIDNDAGTVDAHDTTLKAQNINFKVSAGEIMAERLETEKLKLRVGAGNADIDELKTSNADLTCGVGNIDVKLTGTEKDYNYQVSCGVGNISINDQDFFLHWARIKHVDHGAKKKRDTLRLWSRKYYIGYREGGNLRWKQRNCIVLKKDRVFAGYVEESVNTLAWTDRDPDFWR